MIEGVKSAFADDVADLPDFVKDTMVKGLEMGMDRLEQQEREQWNDGSGQMRPGQNGSMNGMGGSMDMGGEGREPSRGPMDMFENMDEMPDLTEMVAELSTALAQMDFTKMNMMQKSQVISGLEMTFEMLPIDPQ